MLKMETDKIPIIAHGNGSITSCTYCNEELDEENKGKVITTYRNGRTYKEVVCNICFAEPDYQELINSNGSDWKDYPNLFNLL